VQPEHFGDGGIFDQIYRRSDMTRPFTLRNPTPMPGWGLSFGIMLTMLSVVVLIPMAVLLWRGFVGFGAPGCGRW
jgi:hypothetical protein